MAFTLALFDWNGTLFNDLAVTYDATIHLFQRFAPNAIVPTLDEYRQEFLADEIMECYYRRGVPRTMTKQDLYAPWAERYESQCSRARLADGSFKTLRFFSQCGIPLILVSAAPKETVGHLERLGIAPFFERIIFDATNKEEAIRSALDHYPIDPRDAFYVDDTAHGISQAKNAGITTFGFTQGYNSLARIQAANPNYIVDSFMDVTSIVRANIN